MGVVEILSGDPGRRYEDPDHVIELAVDFGEKRYFARRIRAIEWLDWQRTTEDLLTLAAQERDEKLRVGIVGQFAAFGAEHWLDIKPARVVIWIDAVLKGAHKFCISKTDKLRSLDGMLRVMREPKHAEWMPAAKSGYQTDCWKIGVGNLRIFFDLSRDHVPHILDIDSRDRIYRKRGSSIHTS